MQQVLPGASAPTATLEEIDALASATPASRHVVGNVFAYGGPNGSLTDLVVREGMRRWDDASEALGLSERSPMLTPEQATERFGIEGRLTFDRPVSEREAAWRQSAKRDELGRMDILSRNTGANRITPLEALGTQLLGGMVDPVTVPFNLIPGIGQEALLTRLGIASAASRGVATARGLAVGAVEGAVIGGAQEGLAYYLAGQREGRDYDLNDLMVGVGTNALFGASVRGGLDAIGWRPPEVSPASFGSPRVTRAASSAGSATAPNLSPIAPVDLRRAMMAQETGGNPRQVSRDPDGAGPAGGGAVGALQLLPDTARAMARRLGIPFDANRLLNDVDYNVRLSDEYMGMLTARYDGDQFLAVTAYHAGEGNVDRWIQRHGDPRTGAISREAWLARVGRNNPRSARYPREVFARLGREVGEPGVGSGARVEAAFETPPQAVSLLNDEARAGALARAVEDMAADRQVSVGPLIDIELQIGGRARPALDETPDAAVEIKARPLDGVGDDVAVTVRGTEIPVRYAIVEARDMITSHDDDLIRNPAFPEDLQPRDRGRAGSQARLLRMEKEFNPRRLMASPDAESGAPILSRGAVVESGNGRSIMLRRNYERGTKVAAAYRGELERRGYDLAGFDQPVLVRFRTEPMDGQARTRLAREMNGDVTERMSATEQAFADANTLDDTDLGLFAGGEITSVANDAFARRFIDKAGAGQENDLVDGATQRLSQAGVERVQAAMVARAYGDRSLVYALFETQSNTVKAIGKGLMGAAPDWARMRAASARGELAAGADTTEALTAAVALVRHARDNRLKLGELVEDWADQDRLLGGETLSPATQSYLRAFFIDDGLKRPASAETIAATLRETSSRAIDTTPGPDLFGDSHAFDAATILERAARQAREATLRADQADSGARAGDRTGADRGGDEGGGAGDAQGRGQDRLSGGGRSDLGESPRDRPDGEDLEQAAGKDPETQDLEDDIAALEAELDLYVERGLISEDDVASIDADVRDPSLFDLVIETATACLAEGGEA
ncbi:transglycosylase SLT domain-containing protein [Brevundimonas sp.]|uniref:transglycosylase SLT domain-containing protein n=1 Tax=Brevundimonas sp. TaxID=1871086 RepID=UPI002621F69F|nr:transglycosylase SLT domain-containing protein [Brevundimonas sp.]